MKRRRVRRLLRTLLYGSSAIDEAVKQAEEAAAREEKARERVEKSKRQDAVEFEVGDCQYRLRHDQIVVLVVGYRERVVQLLPLPVYVVLPKTYTPSSQWTHAEDLEAILSRYTKSSPKHEELTAKMGLKTDWNYVYVKSDRVAIKSDGDKKIVWNVDKPLQSAVYNSDFNDPRPLAASDEKPDENPLWGFLLNIKDANLDVLYEYHKAKTTMHTEYPTWVKPMIRAYCKKQNPTDEDVAYMSFLVSALHNVPTPNSELLEMQQAAFGGKVGYWAFEALRSALEGNFVHALSAASPVQGVAQGGSSAIAFALPGFHVVTPLVVPHVAAASLSIGMCALVMKKAYELWEHEAGEARKIERLKASSLAVQGYWESANLCTPERNCDTKSCSVARLPVVTS